MTAPVFGDAEVPRDGWGRPKVKLLPDLVQMATYTRVTTHIKCVPDPEGLSKWKRRKVAEGLSVRPDLLLYANSLGAEPRKTDPHRREWSKLMDNTCEQALVHAQGEAAARVGSILHKFMQDADLGMDMSRVPAEYRPHLEAYRDAMTKLGAHPVHIEQFTVNDELRLGGTPDRVIAIDEFPDEWFIADIKTGELNYPLEHCMQLGCYAHSVLYDPATGQRHPYAKRINTDRGLIIGVSADTGLVELRWVDIAAGWEAVQTATQVRAWRARKNLSWPAGEVIAVPPLEAPPAAPELAPTAAAALLVAIDAAKDSDELIELWREAGARWTDEHTARAAARKAALKRVA